jgi:hypothetical protein
MKAKKAKVSNRQASRKLPAPKDRWPDDVVLKAYVFALRDVMEAESALKRRREHAESIRRIAESQGTKLGA